MTCAEAINDIFNILHDGAIESWKGDKNQLTLTIGCTYLAETINPAFDNFYLELNNIEKIEFQTWNKNIQSPGVLKTKLTDIFESDLEILSAEIKNNAVLVSCSVDDSSLNYVGGTLSICCGTYKIFDQDKNELGLEQLGKICIAYWDKFNKK